MWAFVSSSFSLLVLLISYTQCCVCVYALSFILLFLFLNSLTRRIKCPPALGDVRVRVARERESWALYAASLILLVFYKVSDQKLRGRAYTGTLGGKREWQHLFSRKPKRPRKQHRGRLHSITRSLLFSSLLSLFKRRCQLLLSCHFSHLVVSEKDMMKRKEVLFYFFGGERVARFDAQVGYIFRFRLASTEMISRARYRLCTHKTAAR